MNDNITKPSHYQLGSACLEVRDVIKSRLSLLHTRMSMEEVANVSYDYSNAIKYVLRAFGKNGIEDLKKARYCLDNMIWELDEKRNV